MVKLYINTDNLRLFKTPCSAYQLSKRIGCVYSNAHRITKDLWNKGLIEIADTKPSSKNPNIHIIIFKVSKFGYTILEIYDPPHTEEQLIDQ